MIWMVLRADRQGAQFLRFVYFYDMSVGRFKLFYEPGPVKGAAVGQGGIDVGELERRDEVESLADGDGDGFSRLPGLLQAGEFPLFRRDQAALLPGEVDAQGGAEAEGPRVGGDLVDAEQLAQVVEIDVAGLHDGAVEVDVSVTLLLPAAEDPVAHLEGAVAVEGGLRGDQPLFEGGCGDDGFVGGSRRVLSGDRPVFHGMPAVRWRVSPSRRRRCRR